MLLWSATFLSAGLLLASRLLSEEKRTRRDPKVCPCPVGTTGRRPLYDCPAVDFTSIQDGSTFNCSLPSTECQQCNESSICVDPCMLGPIPIPVSDSSSTQCRCSSSSSHSCSSSSSSSSCERCYRRILANFDFNRNHPYLSGPKKNWSYWQYDGLVADGGSLTFSSCGGRLDTKVYTVSAPQSMTYWKDHFKYYIYADAPVTVPEQGRTVFEFKASATTNGRGTNRFPFPKEYVNSYDDVRLASAGFSVFDPQSGMNFAFHLTNSLVYAVYERNITLAGVNGFSYFIPVHKRKPNTVHTMQIVVDSVTKTVGWVLDGDEVLSTNRVGFPLKSHKCYRVNDLGGSQVVTFPRILRYGFGSFTFLDYYAPCRPTRKEDCNYPCDRDALVRTAINYALPQYNPILGPPELAHFYDNFSKQTSRLWGQGSETLITGLRVHQDMCYRVRG